MSITRYFTGLVIFLTITSKSVDQIKMKAFSKTFLINYATLSGYLRISRLDDQNNNYLNFEIVCHNCWFRKFYSLNSLICFISIFVKGIIISPLSSLLSAAMLMIASKLLIPIIDSPEILKLTDDYLITYIPTIIVIMN